MRLWVITRKNHRMVENVAVPLVSPALSDVVDAMDAALKELDIARPLFLPKHEKEIDDYGKTWFLPSDFMETVRFDRLDVEVLHDDDRRRRSNDPRNDFSY